MQFDHAFTDLIGEQTIPLIVSGRQHWPDQLTKLDAMAKAQIAAMDFSARAGQTQLIFNEQGEPALALLGLGDGTDLTEIAHGPVDLPAGNYHYDEEASVVAADILEFYWGQGAYEFDYYQKPNSSNDAKLATNLPVDIKIRLQADYWVRDLINQPAEFMGPEKLDEAAQKLADQHDASINRIVGEALLEQNFPLIHAVGRASDEAPRLVELNWGKEDHPLLTLVGKGVCFDTGGLNLKSGSSMRLMKKDMGGAAHIIGLAHLIMGMKLPVKLRILLPIVENNLSANAFRPSDIIVARNGMSVEIDNTDAEGRLILADCLSYATEDEAHNPDLLIDMATLTGAARTALGPEVMPFYTRDDEIAASLFAQGEANQDPVWRLPLWSPYLSLLNSNIADIANAGSAFAGSITAALFLEKFAGKTEWLHFDIYGWNPTSRTGYPIGAQVHAIYALFGYLQERYAHDTI